MEKVKQYKLLIIADIGDVARSLMVGDKSKIKHKLNVLIEDVVEYHKSEGRGITTLEPDTSSEPEYTDYKDFINTLRLFAYNMSIVEKVAAFKRQFEII